VARKDHSVNEDQKALVEALDQLCTQHITPDYVRECDEQKRYPEEAMAALANAGWSSLPIPEEYGGTQASREDLAIVHHVLARHSLAVSQAYFSFWVLGAESIARLGTDKQKEQWLPRVAKGEARIAFALSEPGSGSDAAALRTSAERVEGGFRVNGQKVFITGALLADVIIVAVRTERTDRKQEGISLLLVDPAAEGLSIRPLPKMGLRALDFCEVFLEDVFVPEDAVVGDLGEGWAGMRLGLSTERTLIAAACVGGLEHVMQLSLDYAREREAFGQPIGRYQLIGSKIADMRVMFESSRLLTMAAARALDEGQEARVEAAMAKLVASESYVTATRDGVQIFGGYGYTEEYPMARHYRDAKFMEIGAGTSEIQRIIIGRSMGVM
jgi:alkylation response protein AidB-like acyl-CoA dehydrogenase